MGNPAASRPRTSRGGPVISSQALAQPSLASSLETRLTATASISCLVTTLVRSRASPAISGKPRTSPPDSVSTTARRTGGTGQSSSAVVTTPSTKDTGAILKPDLSKSPLQPNAVPCRTMLKLHSPANSRRLSSPMLRYFSSRSAAFFRSLESTFYVALTGLLNSKHLHQISTLRFSHSLPLSAELKPEVALSGTSSSCWKDPASSANGPTRGARQVPADPTNPSAPNTPNSSMTEVSLSRERSELSHGISPSPHHPPPALLPSATPATAVSPGSGQAAPTVTGRTATCPPFPPPQMKLSNPNESVLP